MSSFSNQLDQVTELISLPEIYLKVHALMDDSKSELEDFARVIQIDANLSAKLLKAANSAYFGFAGEVSSIQRAVYMMGIQQLHVMVLSISAISAVSSMDFPEDLIDLKTFWRGSLLSGSLSRLLAQQLQVRPFEQFFILGLLHEIGHLVLYAKFPQMARDTRQLANDNNIRIDKAEEQLLGYHYGNIGARLMKLWQLPSIFQMLTNFQPTPELAPDLRREVSILHISHAYSEAHLNSKNVNPASLIQPVVWEATGLSPDQVQSLLVEAIDMSAELESVILR